MHRSEHDAQQALNDFYSEERIRDAQEDLDRVNGAPWVEQAQLPQQRVPTTLSPDLLAHIATMIQDGGDALMRWILDGDRRERVEILAGYIRLAPSSQRSVVAQAVARAAMAGVDHMLAQAAPGQPIPPDKEPEEPETPPEG